ncbi:MAG: DUF559 domain-containing protein [Tepidisphaeraceae bacterium]
MERPNSRKLLPFAKEMRQAPSDAERMLWYRLRSRQLGGLKFRRQVPIGPFIADFACDECKLIVEIDGLQHDDRIDYDANRTATLGELGWRVVRFYAGDVVKDIDSVLMTILNLRSPSP